VKKAIWIACAALALLPSAASAARPEPPESPLFFQAKVVEDGGPCNFFVFEIDRGKEKEYAIVEWMGMDALEIGDRLLGRFEGGPEEIKNESRGTLMSVWVNDFYFSYGMALDAFFKACHEVFGTPLSDAPL
jgi:hypothetical protein